MPSFCAASHPCHTPCPRLNIYIKSRDCDGHKPIKNNCCDLIDSCIWNFCKTIKIIKIILNGSVYKQSSSGQWFYLAMIQHMILEQNSPYVISFLISEELLQFIQLLSEASLDELHKVYDEIKIEMSVWCCYI